MTSVSENYLESKDIVDLCKVIFCINIQCNTGSCCVHITCGAIWRDDTFSQRNKIIKKSYGGYKVWEVEIMEKNETFGVEGVRVDERSKRGDLHKIGNQELSDKYGRISITYTLKTMKLVYQQIILLFLHNIATVNNIVYFLFR